MRIALTGNPNSGKTTMYNAITGRNEKVGNWAGVTVDKIESPIRKKYSAGRDDVIIVETDGTKLVAVKRTDVDLDTKKGREMALADNATTKADLSWDTEELNAVAEDFGIDTDEWDVELDEMPVEPTETAEDDFNEEEDSFEILTAPDAHPAVEAALKESGIALASSEVTMIPQNYVGLTSEDDIKKINKILDLLDEDDDVQAVYHNWDE